MQRFLHVRGKPGVPVTNPHTADPMRFVGLKQSGVAFDKSLHDSPLDLYEPCEEVIPYHADLEKPIRKGELILLGKVGHRSLEQAREHFARVGKPDKEPTKIAPKAPKSGRDE